MSRQDQAVGPEAIAVQASGSVVVVKGVSGEELANIVRAARGDVDNTFVQEAMAEMRRRVERLEDKIIDRFEAGEGNAAALADPDIQLMMVDAKKAFARSGDETLADTLAKILVERSMCTDRDRVALTLNRAVEVTPSLTPQDLSVLSLSFLLLNTKNYGVLSRPHFAEYFRSHLLPFLADAQDAEGSFNYLQATSCVVLTQFASATLEKVLHANYGGVFSKGFELEHFDSRVKALPGGADLSAALISCPEDAKRLRFKFLGVDDLKAHLESEGVPDGTVQAAVGLQQESYLKGDELEQSSSPKFLPPRDSTRPGRKRRSHKHA